MPQTAEQKKINGELRKLGFGSLNDPGLVPAIAYYIRNHSQFRGQLFSVKPDQRRNAYHALKPHLRFEAKSLEQYEIEMKEIAEKNQWGRLNPQTQMIEPFQVGEVGEKPEPACMSIGVVGSDKCPKRSGCESCWPNANLEKVAEAAILADEVELKTLYLTCAKCTRIGEYIASTRTEAEKLAAENGWRASWDGESHCKRCAKKFLVN